MHLRSIGLALVCLFIIAPTIGANEKSHGTPHLTPAKLVGSRFPKDTFGSITVALVGYCPPPSILATYQPVATTEQYFIHVPPASVQICSHGDLKFLSIYHVYGGPVSSALIEELSYYGIKHILAYGLAGGLGTRNLKMGDACLIETAFAEDGTTAHYTDEKIIASDSNLNNSILKLIKSNPMLSNMACVQAVAVDTIYREYDEELEKAIANNCDIINCESSHLFAVSKKVGISTTQCGVISDVKADAQSEWDSTLSVMLSEKGVASNNPLEKVGHIVELYVEKLLPELSKE